ncbi:LysM peptidoglycan-binding domain-containing protein [Fructilactobacillus sanfranciscensis]|uniref:aggregation-promoting factor n=1 Tax=Fructilactobacillus sanfranciscensis TaxID=1625 RepID=UPI001EEFEA37|nr:LysM domain-containing protein [Fructilactobacillus sanfranciscensis]MCG7195204.1 LysM peptidoglycan-binding domain-containing protein [Fructilactobacillus sanfranciscensis]
MKKRNMIKSIATITAVSAGVLFAGSQSASASTVKHTVVSGDTLNKLSAQYGVSVQDLAQANKIQDINKIYVGEVFDIDNGDVQVVAPATTDTPAAATPSVTAPVQQATAPAAQAPVQPAAPVQQAAAPVAQAPVQQSAPATSSVSGSDAAAKEWIAQRESSGSYSAQNGRYIGRYQLDASYLGGDNSPANQERVADNYVTSRYGSWSGAQSFWQSHGWY